MPSVSLLHRHLLISRYSPWKRALLYASRSMSSSGSSSSKLQLPKDVDPSQWVHGLTREEIESNPTIAEFVRANYLEEETKAAEPSPQLPPAEEEEDEQDFGKAAYLEKKADRVQPTYARNIRPLKTYLRDADKEDGSRRSRQLRRDGFIPGLVYGGDPTLGFYSHQPDCRIFVKTPWSLLQGELDRYHRNFESRVYDLTVLEDLEATEGTVHRVTPQNVQRHPIQSTIYCANFVRYHAGRPIKIPVVHVNEEESPVLKRDGFIVPIQRHIEVLVEDGVDIPEHLQLECTGLQHKDVIRLDRINMPDGVRVSERVLKRGREYVIGVTFGRSSYEEEEEEGEKAGAEEASEEAESSS